MGSVLVAGGAGFSDNATRDVVIPAERCDIRSALVRYLELYPAKQGEYLFRNPRTSRP